MIESVLVHLLQYSSYVLELALVALLFTRGRWKGVRSIAFYFLGYVALDTIFRPTVLYIYGFSSPQYRYSYWMSDVFLTLGAFLLICLLFRRACSGKPEAWSYIRSMLAAVFVIIAFISYFSIAHHYEHLFGHFIVGLQQNLYFACLVLNTLLYIMLQQWSSVDDKLSLLVCGLGIEFAGPAANMALMYLTPGGKDAGLLLALLIPLCNLGMCVVWLFAVAQKTDNEAALHSREKDLSEAAAFADVTVQKSMR
ncbi:MAG TPA: hypothetical protein VGX94_05730 [Terriglobia bacterium]|nr:hypothetical protein [Terriglobia bacterium]